MDGLGNDFFIIEPANGGIKLSAKDIRRLGDRKTGVGFDQLFVLKPSKKADIKMVIYNSDGSEAGACGNGARCVADWVFKNKGVRECSIEAPGGKILCREGDLHLKLPPPEVLQRPGAGGEVEAEIVAVEGLAGLAVPAVHVPPAVLPVP